VKSSANLTREFLRQELEIKLGELQEKWHFSSLEKIFIEKRIYRDIEKEETWEGVIAAVDKGLKPYLEIFKRAIVQDDILRLLEIKIKRISKFDSFRADELIKGIEDEIEEVEGHLAQITRYAVRYLKELKKKYGKGRERKTEISQGEDGQLLPFDKIVASQVVVANETLYLNRKDGFAGFALKKDEVVEKCSTLDDVVVFGKDGGMKVMKIADKMFVGKSPLRVAVFRRDDQKVYNMVYRDGQSGRLYAKKFKVGGVTREKEYPLFKKNSKSRIFFFAVHDSEKKNSKILVHIDPELKRVREKVIEFDFAWLEIQGRGVKGSTLTAHKVDRVVNAPRENAEGEEVDTAEDVQEKKSVIQSKAKPEKPKVEEPKKISVPPSVEKAKEVVSEIKKQSNGEMGKDQVTFDFEGN
jgi:topoisomerase-4 subunit A